jgi:hypothetical protein
LIELRNQMNKTLPLVSVGMIVMEQNRPEVEVFRQKWEGLADKVMFRGLTNRVGSVDWVPLEKNRHPGHDALLLPLVATSHLERRLNGPLL